MLRFIDGFDHVAATDIIVKWGNSAGNAPTLGSGRYGTGTQCLHAGYDCQIIKSLDNQPTLIIGFAFQINTLPNGDAYHLVTLQDVNTAQCCLVLNSDGSLEIRRGANTVVTGGRSAPGIIGSNAWQYVEFQVTIGSSIAANSAQIRAGGSVIATVAAGQSLQSSANAYANRIYLGEPSDSFNRPTMSFDDLYVCDATGTHNNTFLGDVRVECLYPAGAGSDSQWTAVGAASNYAAVDEHTPNGDSSYVEASTPSFIDSYAMGTLSSAASAIMGIQTVVYCRKDDAGARSIAATIKSGGTIYPGNPSPVFDNYAMALEIRETDPATGAAWVAAGINAMEAGVKLAS